MISEETRKRLSLSKMGSKNPMFGKVSCWKGKHLSEETKRKLSIAHLGKKQSEQTKFKKSMAMMGKHNALGCKHTEETKRNLSLRLLGNIRAKGKKHRFPESLEHRNKIALSKLGKKRPEISNENSYIWKGDNVGYRALHSWIKRKLGSPHYCEHCKDTTLNHRQYNWSNISRKYKRELSDWQRLCVKCHVKYDKK